MASNFRSDLDNFKPGELHLKQKLLSTETKQPLDSRAIEISTFDVSADFLSLGFSCVGVTLTADNTGIWKNGTPGRLSNKELAEALKKELYSLIKKALSTIPLWCAWVFERHKNGSPHIHAMLFCPIGDLAHVIALCKRLYDSESVQVNVLSPMYLFKNEKWQWALVEKNEDFPAALCSKILARTAVDFNVEKNKLVRRNVAKIKDVQTTKELHSVCNTKLRRKYPNAELALGNLFFELWRYWKYAHCRSKRERVADNTDKYDRLILGLKNEDENENETDDEPFPVNRFVLVQPTLGAFGRDPHCKLKTKADDELAQLDVTLWTKNNTERLHVNLRNVYLSKKRIQNLKLWGKKCRNKDDLLTLYRTLFSGKKICGRDPLRMLDFAPKDLSEYDRELVENRYNIRSWLGYVAPLLKNKTKPLDPDIRELLELLENFAYENNKPATVVDRVNFEVCCT